MAAEAITNEELYRRLVTRMNWRLSGFRIVYKDESKLHRAIGRLIRPINPRYMGQFWTTYGKTIAVPSYGTIEKDYWRAFYVLAHEYVHMWDYQLSPWRYVLRYVLPQGFAVLSLLALLALFLSKYFLLMLVFLLCLGPWPSASRTGIELRGFGMGVSIDAWAHGKPVSALALQGRANYFKSWEYYRMWTDRVAVVRALDVFNRIARLTATGQKEAIDLSDEDTPYMDVFHILDEAGRVKRDGEFDHIYVSTGLSAPPANHL